MATIMDLWIYGFMGFLEKKTKRLMPVKRQRLTYWKANAGLSLEKAVASSANDLQASCTLSNPKSALQCLLFASKD